MLKADVERPPSGRIAGLDGLRGVAAALVLVHHALLLTPVLIQPYRTPRESSLNPIAWAFTYTPAHLLWDGPAAVFIFFVLSGFVLTIPMRSAPRRWSSYYPARLLRLYLPVWAAVLLALCWEALIPRVQLGSSWVQGHHPPSAGGIVRDLFLVVGAPGATSSALWSLRWEVVFSLLLPLFIAFALTVRRLVWVKLVLLATLLLIGAYRGPVDAAYDLSWMFQLPIFGFGCVLAVEWERVRDATRRMLSTRLRMLAAAVVSVLLLTSYWIVSGVFQGSDPLWLLAFSRLLQVTGAVFLVVFTAALPRWGAALSVGPVHWLGTRSFSLYLVHEPVVASIGRLLPAPVFPIVSMAIAVPVSLLLTEVFFRLVERPSHRISRWASRRIRAGRSGKTVGA